MSAPRSALLPCAAEARLERDSPIALHRQLAQVLRDAITVDPAAKPSIKPSAPSTTRLEIAGSGSEVSTMSDAAPSARGESMRTAPASSKGASARSSRS